MDDPRCSSPIFVVGVPRSGTTLLAAMLGAHPRLVCGPETHFFDGLPEDPGRHCRPGDWPGAAIDYLYSIRHVGESIPANYGLTREELTEELGRREPSISSILSGMIDLYARRYGRPRWAEKTPDHLPHVAAIRRYFPDSPIVRIVRDPRAVAASLRSLSWGPNSLMGALGLWRYYDDRSARFFEIDRHCHTVRYEDLVADLEAAMRGVCLAIDEPFDPAMLDTHRSARLVNATNEPYKAKVAERPDPSRAGAWQESFSPEELRLAEAWIGNRIRAYGYPALGPACPHYVEAHARGPMGVGPFAECGDAIVAMAAQGCRFWGHPGERPTLSLFLGDPNGWLGAGRRERGARTAGIAWRILRRRLGGVPIAWLAAPRPADLAGHCARSIARLLPRPATVHDLPGSAIPSGPARSV